MSESSRELSEGKPWYRHRWPWLLMLGPALAVVGCVITIVLAFQAFGDQGITDGGTRQGLVVTAPAARH
ncbi:hypothetical protein [Castellaniella sp.]|uniref:hypothetical protein n=1 Tax=Castellaniella sp. TaxID=1955812 RepID=UPI0035603BED